MQYACILPYFFVTLSKPKHTRIMSDWNFHSEQDLVYYNEETIYRSSGDSYSCSCRLGPGWIYNDKDFFPADENGWIDAKHDPPKEDDYLVHSGISGLFVNYWGDGFTGYQCWNDWPERILKWKPILPPVEKPPKKRYTIEEHIQRGDYHIVDCKYDKSVAWFNSKIRAEDLLKRLNGDEA